MAATAMCRGRALGSSSPGRERSREQAHPSNPFYGMHQRTNASAPAPSQRPQARGRQEHRFQNGPTLRPAATASKERPAVRRFEIRSEQAGNRVAPGGVDPKYFDFGTIESETESKGRVDVVADVGVDDDFGFGGRR